jgi:hypothetical protein
LRNGYFDFEKHDGMKRSGQKLPVKKAAVRRGQHLVNAA